MKVIVFVILANLFSRLKFWPPTMADITKDEKDIASTGDGSHDIHGGRRGSLVSINLNKNLDAK